MESMTHLPAATGTPFRLAGAPLFYRFEAQLEFVPISVVPERLRMTDSCAGRVTEGEFPGARVWGIDHLLVRNDGVGIIDSQKTISHDTFHVYECVSGYCLPPADLQVPAMDESPPCVASKTGA
jgi:hypothetical protein